MLVVGRAADPALVELEFEAGAARECQEEALATVTIGTLLAVVNIPEACQVHVFFRAALLDTAFEPGPESLEAKLFREDEIPWDSLAFRTVAQTLRWFFADRREGTWSMHSGAVGPRRPTS